MIFVGGTNNTPFDHQKDIDKLPLTDDPDSSMFPWPDFNFDFPELEIPVISGIFGLSGSGLFIIILLIILVVIIFVASVFISRFIRKTEDEDQLVQETEEISAKKLIKKRITLGRRIEDISAFLSNCLDEGDYSKGITEGFEQLDIAMKEFSEISRPGWLTPREYANMRIPYFNHQALSSAVEIFYRSTYSSERASLEDMYKFIENFQEMIIDFSILKWKADLLPLPEGDYNHD